MIKLKIKTRSVNLTGRQGKVRFGVFSFKFVTLEILFYVHVTHGFFLKFVCETRSRLYLYCPCTWDQLLHLWGGWEGLVLVVLEVKGIAIYFDVSCYNFQDCHCQCLINNQGLKQYLKRVCDMDTLLEMLLQGWLLKGWFNCNENLGLKLKFCFDFLLLFCSCDLNSDPLLCLLNLEISV